ncbi:MAG TPA: Uma2 family endonuclease [Armatimonadota bacterium]|jgi:Uma2 family endonuclease
MAVSPPQAVPATMTFEEFIAYPHADPHVEWVNGKVVPMSPVTERHADVVGFLSALIRTYAGEKRLGAVYGEPYQMRAAENLPSRSPDIVYVAAANAARVLSGYLNGPADVAIEVVSPESRGRDRGEKYYEYEEGGVGEYWIVDPDRLDARFFQRDAHGAFQPVAVSDDGVYHSKAIDGFWLRVEWLWRIPAPGVLDTLKEIGLVQPTN